jgi:hypothetical protein
VTSKPLDSSIEYYCPVYEETRVTEEQIHTAKEMRWNTFDLFKRRNFAVWIFTLSKDSEKCKKK